MFQEDTLTIRMLRAEASLCSRMTPSCVQMRGNCVFQNDALLVTVAVMSASLKAFSRAVAHKFLKVCLGMFNHLCSTLIIRQPGDRQLENRFCDGHESHVPRSQRLQQRYWRLLGANDNGFLLTIYLRLLNPGAFRQVRGCERQRERERAEAQ